MQGYYVDAEDTSLDLDWEATMAYVADMRRYPVAPMTLKNCANPLCCQQSYAIYCGEYCRQTVEGAEEPSEADDYYHSADITLGYKTTADAQHQADLAAGGFAAMVCGVQPQDAAVAVPALPESPCSVNTYVELAGRQVQVTLRGVDEAEVLTRLATLLQRFPLQGQQATAAQPPQGEWCGIHAVALYKNVGKDGATWWSHKLADGHFCKGKGVRNG